MTDAVSDQVGRERMESRGTWFGTETTGIHALAAGGGDARTMAAAVQQDNPQQKVVAARDRTAALPLADDLIRHGDIVPVKGSHSVELEHTAERLAYPGTRPATARTAATVPGWADLAESDGRRGTSIAT